MYSYMVTEAAEIHIAKIILYIYIGAEEGWTAYIETYLNILKFALIYRSRILNLVIHTCERYPGLKSRSIKNLEKTFSNTWNAYIFL